MSAVASRTRSGVICVEGNVERNLALEVVRVTEAAALAGAAPDWPGGFGAAGFGAAGVGVGGVSAGDFDPRINLITSSR